MDIQERIKALQMLFGSPEYALLGSPEYIVFPGEIPWYDIKDYMERYRVHSRQRMRVESKLHPKRNAERKKKWNEMHPGLMNMLIREYRKTEKGHALMTACMSRFRLTPKGKANLAKMTAKRRERSTDPEAYAARVELLHILQEPCTKCHTPYKITYQIDHILALCLGGTDDWDNLQPLCIQCHKEKTNEDMQVLSGVKGARGTERLLV